VHWNICVIQTDRCAALFETGVLILGGATLVHLIFIGIGGRLPRTAGWLLTAAYGVFLYKGLIK
jgi:cation:H+ antiporter